MTPEGLEAPYPAPADDDTGGWHPEGRPLSPGEWTLFDRSEPPRPAESDKGPGRFVRAIAGVREELLDWVPEERSRYTRLGMIAVNTGLLAALSLFAALHKIAATTPWGALLTVCLIWALLVIGFDTWLIASTHGVLSRAKLAVFIPRLVISVWLGAAIAEPLVLWVFQPAITKEVKAGRQAELDAEGSRWTRCNPASGDRNSTPECAQYQLSLPDSPQPVRNELNQKTQRQVQLKNDVAAINDKIDQLQQLARDECSGNSGRGLTGRRGEGPNCRQLRSDVGTFRTISGLADKEKDLAGLNQDIGRLEASIKDAGDRYEQSVAAAIKEKVKAKGDSQGAIGLLEEMAALDRLSAKNTVIDVAQWVLRLLLIAIDCMPLLAKVLGGATRYDHIVSAQLQAGTAMHGRYLSFQERSFEQSRRAQVEELDANDRAVRAKRRAHTRKSVNALFEELYAHRTGHGPPAGDEATVRIPRQSPQATHDPWVEAGTGGVNGAGSAQSR